MKFSYSAMKIQRELERVSKWFSRDGTYYDNDGNIVSISGALVKESSSSTLKHINGELDSKTGREFSCDQQAKIQLIQQHNLIHNSAAERSQIYGLSLLEGMAIVNNCRVDQLKAMVIAQGGSVTGRDGKSLGKEQLVRIVKAYLALEKENPKHTEYCDRSRKQNGIFANINTSKRQSVDQMLNRLVSCGEHEQSQQLHRAGQFIDDQR
jgi:hypothetical protein